MNGVVEARAKGVKTFYAIYLMRNPKLVKISLDIILPAMREENEEREYERKFTGEWNDFIYLPNKLLFH